MNDPCTFCGELGKIHERVYEPTEDDGFPALRFVNIFLCVHCDNDFQTDTIKDNESIEEYLNRKQRKLKLKKLLDYK